MFQDLVFIAFEFWEKSTMSHLIYIHEKISKKKFARLYVLNTTQAIEVQLTLTNISQNENCLQHILREWDLIMHDINPFAQAFRMMFETETKWGSIPHKVFTNANVYMVLQRDTHTDQAQYNLPTANYVAMVYKMMMKSHCSSVI